MNTDNEEEFSEHVIGLAELDMVISEDGYTKHDPEKAEEILRKAGRIG
jgi:hypothetical protein